MKISFIEPKPKFAGFSFSWQRTVPLLGTVYLATLLKNKGYDVEILKDTIREVTPDDVQESDIVCFSAMSSQAARAQYLIKEIRKNFPEKKIIIGGIHASFRPEDFPEADYIVIGEGENVILDLIEGKFKERIVKGSPFENLDSLPFPDYSLIKNVRLPLKMAPLSTSRGCPFNCKFCSATKMFGKKYRFRSPESVIEEMQSKKTRGIIFCDDNFFSNKERAKKILKTMKDTQTTPLWWAEGRVDIVKDDELMKLISETNNMEIAVGFESINPAVLKSYRKGQKFEDIVNCIKKFKDYGIKLKGFFIGGADEDDKDAFKQIVDFIEKYEIDTATFTILTPLPGTELYEKLDRQKRIFTKDWGNYDTLHIVFKPKKMSAYELQRRQFDALYQYYNANLRWIKFWLGNFWDTFQMLNEYKRGKRANAEYMDFLKKADPR